jgi:hypothetical protein
MYINGVSVVVGLQYDALVATFIYLYCINLEDYGININVATSSFSFHSLYGAMQLGRVAFNKWELEICKWNRSHEGAK